MIEEARFPSVQKFRSLTDHERSEIIEKYLEKDQNPNWSFNLSADETRNFISQMLDTGRFERFEGMAGFQQRSFANLNKLGSECDFLFQLDELEPDLDIRLIHVPSGETFEEFQEIISHYFKTSISENLQSSLHKYFVVYGSKDYNDVFGDCINPYELDNYNVISTEDSFMAQTAVSLSRVYGEDKIIPIIDRINSGDNISAYELLKIVRSEKEPLSDAPLSWSIALV